MAKRRLLLSTLALAFALVVLTISAALADFKFVQITDTHVDTTRPDYNARYEEAIKQINALSPAFVIHTGDALEHFTADNAALFKEISKSLKPKLYSIPGNHDVGHKKSLDGAITEERRDAWMKAMGYDRVSFEHEGCVFIGLNSSLLGSGLAAEKTQMDWLKSELGKAAGKRIFVFQHFPIFDISPHEKSGGYFNTDEPARSELLALLKKHNVEAVLSGHMHRFHEAYMDGVCHLTTPALSFSCSPDKGLTGYRVFSVVDGAFTTWFVDLRKGGTPPDFTAVEVE